MRRQRIILSGRRARARSTRRPAATSTRAARLRCRSGGRPSAPTSCHSWSRARPPRRLPLARDPGFARHAAYRAACASDRSSGLPAGPSARRRDRRRRRPHSAERQSRRRSSCGAAGGRRRGRRRRRATARRSRPARARATVASVISSASGRRPGGRRRCRGAAARSSRSSRGCPSCSRSQQRVWKRQPDGGFAGEGTSPCSTSRFLRMRGSGFGHGRQQRDRVRDAAGPRTACSTAASSTILPRYMTPTRSLMYWTTERLWA